MRLRANAALAAVLVLAILLLPASPAPAQSGQQSGGQAGAQTDAQTDAQTGDLSDARGPVTNLPLPRFVSVRAETANARRGPGLDHRVDWAFVQRGLPLEVTAEYGNWRRVRDSDGLGGWVHHSLLSGVRTALVQADAPVPVHAGPGERTAVRALAEPGAIARIERCAQEWCQIAASGIAGWVPRETLWGAGADETID